MALFALAMVPLLTAPVVSSSPLVVPSADVDVAAHVEGEGGGMGSGGGSGNSKPALRGVGGVLEGEVAVREGEGGGEGGRVLQAVGGGLWPSVSYEGEGGKMLDGRDRCFVDEDGFHRCYPTVFFFGTSKCGESCLRKMTRVLYVFVLLCFG